jgi:hypothetical protein
MRVWFGTRPRRGVCERVGVAFRTCRVAAKAAVRASDGECRFSRRAFSQANGAPNRISPHELSMSVMRQYSSLIVGTQSLTRSLADPASALPDRCESVEKRMLGSVSTSKAKPNDDEGGVGMCERYASGPGGPLTNGKHFVTRGR